MAKKPWKKILYKEQDYPDNYVDKSFLDELRKNGKINMVVAFIKPIIFFGACIVNLNYVLEL